MKQQLVFTVITKDKPGIVTILSELIKGFGGSWLDSRMSQLAGEFAGIVHVEISSEKIQKLEEALSELVKEGIEINIRQSGETTESSNYRLHQIEIVGNDRNGIVAEVSRLFLNSNINILEFDTQITDAAMSGGLLFHADAVIGVGRDISLDDLTDSLHDLADELGLDIEWTSTI